MSDSLPPTVLVGRWTLSRRILDRRLEASLSVVGTLTITAENDDLLGWSESGHLRREGFEDVPVWRRYLIERRADGWMVTFDDGRDFHPWAPGSEAVHPCSADTYRGAFDLSGLPDTWSVDWDVTGPTKDYRMHTELSSVF